MKKLLEKGHQHLNHTHSPAALLGTSVQLLCGSVCGMVVGARQSGISISETADLFKKYIYIIKI